MPVAAGLRHAGCAAVLAITAGCYPALDWREVTSTEGGFVVLLPARPGSDTRNVRIGERSLSMTMLSVRVDAYLYGAGYAKLNEAIDAPGQAKLLEDAQRALLANFGANSSAPVRYLAGDNRLATLDGHPCVTINAEPTVNQRSLALNARLCATSDRFFQLVSLAPRDRVTDADATLFLSSLRLLK
jgi:hypothetical protein